MMTFAFCISSMNTEVALQLQPRGSLPWIMGALKVSCCDHCRCCSAVSVSGSCEFLESSLFKVGSCIMNQASPFCLSMAYPSRSLGLMWHDWRLALTVSLYRCFGRPWFLLPAWSTPYIKRLGNRYSSIRITCPTQRSRALMMVASMLVDLAWSRTSRLLMWSCYLIPKMERRACMWKISSFLIYLRYSVHVSQP